MPQWAGPGTITFTMIEAIRTGKATTSRDLAILVGSTTSEIAARLAQLEESGRIARGRTENSVRRGRPCLLWRAL